jgi:hypothetical protein
MVNDVKKFNVNGTTWYLMGLHTNMPSCWYRLSNDGINFTQEQTMFLPAYSPQDAYIITLSFVTRGNQILGVLYGANTSGASLPLNSIFTRWLQMKVLITDASGTKMSAQGAYGPDRQWFQSPSSGSLTGDITVYAEDGITPLGKGSVTITPGQSYKLVLN